MSDPTSNQPQNKDVVQDFLAASREEAQRQTERDKLRRRGFRVAGTAAFLCYAGAQPMNSIWKGNKWSTTVKNIFDGLVYALLTAGAFGWLWPR